MEPTAIRKVVPIPIVLIILSASSGLAQTGRTGAGFQCVLRDSSKAVWDVGAGLGLPYGAVGGKASLGASLVTGDVGLGLVPIPWSPEISVGGAIHFRGRHAALRPKVTLAYSNVGEAIGIIDPGDSDALYHEHYPGIGICGGVDWRPAKTSAVCLDLNLGWIFTFVGSDEILKRLRDAEADLRSRGYEIEEKEYAFHNPKAYLGIVYAPKRRLELKPTQWH